MHEVARIGQYGYIKLISFKCLNIMETVERMHQQVLLTNSKHLQKVKTWDNNCHLVDDASLVSDYIFSAVHKHLLLPLKERDTACNYRD